MELTTLTAVSPIDGRYGGKTADLRSIFSELWFDSGHRVLIEVRWLQALAAHSEIVEVPPLSEHANNVLNGIVDNFTTDDAQG